jgi:hypothetical protein
MRDIGRITMEVRGLEKEVRREAEGRMEWS